MVVVVCAAIAQSRQAQQVPVMPETSCAPTDVRGATSDSDLYCIELFHTPEFPMSTLFPKGQAFEKAFYEAGGLLATGVDPTGMGGALPGYGDQRNYELLLEAGFTPEQVIQVMTLNGARVLGKDADFGSVEPGKLADLVIINGTPVARPAEIKNVTLVFKEGVGYDSPKLIESVMGLVGLR